MKSKPSSRRRIGLGLVGSGARARMLFRLIKAHHPDVPIDIVALCEPNTEHLSAARRELSATARVYEDPCALAAAPEVDWVVVSSPNYLHARHVQTAFSAGKHVFCEKPLATSLADCLKMQRSWKQSGKTFFFGLCLRYSPHYTRVAQLVSEGVLGRLISFEHNETLGFNHGGYIMGNWRRRREWAGTHLLEKCCHDIDIAHWLTGSLPIKAASLAGLDFFVPRNARRIKELGKDPQGRDAYMQWADPGRKNPFTSDKSIVDNQVVILQYAGGMRASFHTNCNAALPERRLYMLGTHGAIRADAVTGRIEWQRIGFGEKPRVEEISTEGGHGGADEKLIDAFVQTVLHGKKPVAGMPEAIRSALTCFGIDRAADSGKVVDLRPLWKKAGVEV